MIGSMAGVLERQTDCLFTATTISSVNWARIFSQEAAVPTDSFSTPRPSKSNMDTITDFSVKIRSSHHEKDVPNKAGALGERLKFGAF